MHACVCACVFVSVNMYVCIWFISSLYACIYVLICICVHVYMCTQHIHVFGPFHNDLVRVSDQGAHILDHCFYIKHAGSVLDT